MTRLRCFGGHGAFELGGGAAASGRFHVAVDETRVRPTLLVRGARDLDAARPSSVVAGLADARRQIAVQACEPDGRCQVVGLDGHAGRVIWRGPGRCVGQQGTSIHNAPPAAYGTVVWDLNGNRTVLTAFFWQGE